MVPLAGSLERDRNDPGERFSGKRAEPGMKKAFGEDILTRKIERAELI